MILRKVDIYSPKMGQYLTFEALIDTGATVCAMAKHLGEAIGLVLAEAKTHLWQVRDPLVLEMTKVDVRYKSKTYTLDAVMVTLPERFRRAIKPGEECTRPRYPNPLSKRIILGENFLKLLPKDEIEDITFEATRKL